MARGGRDVIRSACRDAWRFTLSLVRDPHDGSFSPVAAGSVTAMFFLSKGFIAEVADRNVGWMDFLGYAAAMAIASGAPIAEKLVAVMWPKGAAPPA